MKFKKVSTSFNKFRRSCSSSVSWKRKKKQWVHSLVYWSKLSKMETTTAMATPETCRGPKKKQNHLLWSKLLKKIHDRNHSWSKVTKDASKLGCSNYSLANKAEAHSLTTRTHDQQEDKRGLMCVCDLKEGIIKKRCWIFNLHLKQFQSH